jgi:hypothetical protein
VSRENKIWQELLALKALTETTGVIHEAQKFQLQCWAQLIFPHGDNIEIGIQLPWTEHEGTPAEIHHDIRAVEFRVWKTAGKPPKDLTKRLKALDGWVKRLLGDRFEVRAAVKGKVIFTGKGKPLKKKTNE